MSNANLDHALAAGEASTAQEALGKAVDTWS